MQLSGAIAGRLAALSLALLWDLPSEVRISRIPADLPWGVSKVENEIALKLGLCFSQTNRPTFSHKFCRWPHLYRVRAACAWSTTRQSDREWPATSVDPTDKQILYCTLPQSDSNSTRGPRPGAVRAAADCTRSFVHPCPQAVHPQPPPRSVVPALMAANCCMCWPEEIGC